ncbi:MAG: winged helix-turn-helix domain-containing protein [Clostridiales bacterium]|nr:winged helix-turn-helix domain-containing protein [Clostridiales bacterium]
MRKNIGFINMDGLLADWLTDQLKGAPAEAVSADEFAAAIDDLRSGKSSSLMVEMYEDGAGSSPSDGRLVCGDISIFEKSRKVTRDGEEIALTPKEFDILYFLAKNRGEVFTKEQIYKAVWDDEYLMDDSNIMAFIRKLRKKVEPAPDSPKYILTIWGIGYKFSDEV